MKLYKHLEDPTSEEMERYSQEGWEIYSEENVVVVLEIWIPQPWDHPSRRYDDKYLIIYCVTLVKEVI